MRILIASPLYPPEVGGPAYYAVGLGDALKKKGHKVTVVTYGVLKYLPSGLRHIAFFLRVLPNVMRADIVIALDTFSVGVPTAFLCRIARTPLVVRTGGDFLWEQYLERTHDLLPLPYFYERHKQFSLKEKLIFALTKFGIRDAIMVFSTTMQRDIWMSAYGIKSENSRVIENAIERPLESAEPVRKNFLWHVRPIVMKNGDHVRAAFEKAKKMYPDIILEEGTMSKEKLLNKMKNCYAVILPSLTEISPNYILDALRFKKPFIMDKYSGLAEVLAPYGLLVDPLDEETITRAIQTLADPALYKEASEKAARFSRVRTYDAVADDFLNVVKTLN